MMSVRFMLDGHRIYRDTGLPYGPSWCFSRWLCFRLCGVPLGHDSVRLLSCFFRCATSLCLGLAVFRFPVLGWKRPWLAAACFVGAVSQLSFFVDGPGHPQEMIVAALSAAFLLPCSWRIVVPSLPRPCWERLPRIWRSRRSTWACSFAVGARWRCCPCRPKGAFGRRPGCWSSSASWPSRFGFFTRNWTFPGGCFAAASRPDSLVAFGPPTVLAPRTMGWRECLSFFVGGTTVAVPLAFFSFAALGSPLETFDALVLRPSRTFGGGQGSLIIKLPIAAPPRSCAGWQGRFWRGSHRREGRTPSLSSGT